MLGESAAGRFAEVSGLGRFWIPKEMEEDLILKSLGSGQEWDAESTPIYEKYVRPGDTVMDVGAFNGSRSIRLSRLVGPQGTVYAWEPNPSIRHQLNFNLLINRVQNVVVLPFAAGKSAETVDMWLAPNNGGGTSLVRGCHASSHGGKVHVLPMDAVMPERQVKFIKIDVEGLEYELLQGATKLLTRDRPTLFLEIWDEPTRRLKSLRTSQAQVFRLLTELGYNLPRVCRHAPHDYIVEPVVKVS